MKKATLNYCLSVLETQKCHVKKQHGRIIRSQENLLQDSYYHGMRDMLEMVLTEAYSEELPKQLLNIFVEV